MGPAKQYNPKRKRDPLAVQLGRAIQEHRRQVGLAQDEAAHNADVYRSYMGFIEQGRVNITVRKLKQVCGGLGIKPSELLARIGL